MTDDFFCVLFSWHSRPIRRSVISSGILFFCLFLFVFLSFKRECWPAFRCLPGTQIDSWILLSTRHVSIEKRKKKNVVDRLMFISFVKEFRQLIAALGKRQKKELYVTAVRSSLLVTGEGWRRILSVLVLHGRVEQTVCLVNFWKNNHNHYDSNNLSVGGKKKNLQEARVLPFSRHTKHD